ncbi:MAG: leucyl aminopeptidase [Paraperlucidibaca sp.]|jgi:leucyl aminopeptidase|nr:leucyl aminopeptidase [Paraperlucidibaca sp.]MBQ0722581.1 leucyl aminopeptidase [Paraperlucidibaca sp.]MBQ0842033.1 leucyl aminopeptidase [Paraperlucidibaca sp.]
MDLAVAVIAHDHLAEAAHTALVIAAQGTRLSPAATALNEASAGALQAALDAAGFEGKPGQTQTLYGLNGVKASLVLVVGAGDTESINLQQWQKIITSAMKALPNKMSKVASTLCELPVAGRDLNERISDHARFALAASYRFDAYKTKKPTTEAAKVKLTLAIADKAELKTAKEALVWGQCIGTGQNFARDLGNQPANVAYPGYLAEMALALGDDGNMKVDVKGDAELRKMGMHCLLSVSAGSAHEAQLVTMTYSGGKAKDAPVVLVGKGITFDTGGISLKPGSGMDEMKYDMCGAASVLGVMAAIKLAKLKLNVIGVIACAENMPSSTATRPGDIVTTLSGQTVEILNTDAEGRLVLCDALTYVERFKPAAVVDIATLTGACVVALGKVATGLFSPKDELADELLAAGQRVDDRAWRMPVWDDYQELLDSPFADIANIGGPTAGSITAACYLARFTKAYDWAHLDIAGTAWLSGAAKGSTGRPVPLLLEFLRARAAA